MSEGPIKKWRDAHLPKRSIPQSEAMHFWDATTGRAKCGRKPLAARIVHDPHRVSCSDCLAALAADGQNGGAGR